MKNPLARFAFMATFYSAFMFVWMRWIMPGRSMALDAVIWGVAGLFFATAMTLWFRRMERRAAARKPGE